MHRPILALSLVVTSACSFQMRARGAANGAEPVATPAPAPEPPSSGSGKGHGKTWSASFHKSGSVKFDWQGRSGQLCRASAPFKFVGMAKASGSAQLNPNGTVTANGTAQASGKTSGGSVATGECSAPRTHVPATPKAVPVTHPEKPEPPKADKSPKPLKPEIGKTAKPDPKALPESKPRPSAKPEPTPTPTPTPTPAPGPTPVELEKPVDPPADPPPNVFGYEKPVLGCFEGQVFPLANDAPKLPTDYAALTPVSVVYACEWDIAPRAWDQGFPGIADRFEWFAIRYSGAFRIATAGEYAFRISSDDGTKVLIDGKQVIDNDGQHPPKEASGKVQLSAGDHQMVLEYFQGPRFHINLQLWVTPPGKPEELFTVR
jgi:PA14 domain